MKKLFLIFVMSGIAAILCALCACGGDSTPNDKPTASAGETQDVNASASVTLNGSGSSDLNGNTLTYAWTQTSGTTVTLSSAAAVQPTFTAGGTPQTYVFQLIVNDGTVDSDPATVTIRVWMDTAKRLFVNASASAASADGSQTNPYTTISSAITAATVGGEDVYVAAGTYTENITMAEGVSIFGGYEATNWTRNITTNATTISPSASNSPTILAGAGLTASTYVSGFTITGPTYSGATGSTVVMDNGGVLTISSNTISGGTTTSDGSSSDGFYTIACSDSGSGLTISGNTITLGSVVNSDNDDVAEGIFLSPCSGVIEGNTISGSSDPAYSVVGGVIAINSEGVAASTVTIQQNTINAGKNAGVTAGFSSIGINIRGGAATITRNRINGGDGISSGAIGSAGIANAGSGSVAIENNIVYAGDGYTSEPTGADSSAIDASSSGNNDIVNNTIYLGGATSGGHTRGGISQRSTGTLNVINNLIIQDSDISASLQKCLYWLNITGVIEASAYNSVLNNDCSAVSGGAVYYTLTGMGTATNYTSVADMLTALTTEGTAAANTTGNVAVDPALQTGSDYLLSSASPLIGAGYSGSLVTLPTVDYDGNARPTSTGYDIGADQYYAP